MATMFKLETFAKKVHDLEQTQKFKQGHKIIVCDVYILRAHKLETG